MSSFYSFLKNTHTYGEREEREREREREKERERESFQPKGIIILYQRMYTQHTCLFMVLCAIYTIPTSKELVRTLVDGVPWVGWGKESLKVGACRGDPEGSTELIIGGRHGEDFSRLMYRDSWKQC